jgi:hypothetical protein
VLVAFSHEQNSQPLVVSKTHNDQHSVPFALPTSQSKSGVKTQSVAATGNNELSFDDAPGKQAININAQNSYNLNVNNAEKLNIKNAHTVTIQGDHSTTLPQGKHTLYSPKQVVLQAGLGKITITPSSLTVQGPQVALGNPGSPVPMAAVPKLNVGVPVVPGPAQASTSTSSSSTLKKKIIFLVDSPTNPPQLSATVNTINQQSIANNAEYPYPLTEQQQSGPLNLTLNDNSYSVLSSISSLTFNEQGEAPVYIGTRDRTAKPADQDPKSIAKAIGNESEKYIVVKKMPTPPASVQTGWIDLTKTSEDALNWLYTGLMNPNIVPFAEDLISIGSSPEAMALLTGVFGSSRVKVQQIGKEFYIIFKGGRDLPDWVRSTPTSIESPSLQIIRNYAKIGSGNLSLAAEGIKDIAKETQLGILLVSAIDVLNYFVMPENKKDFADLVANLIGDIVKFEVITLLIDIIAGLAVGAGMPVALAVLGSTVIIAGLGLFIDMIEKESGTEDYLDHMAEKCQSFIESKVGGIAQQQAQAYINQAQQAQGYNMMQQPSTNPNMPNGFFGM